MKFLEKSGDLQAAINLITECLVETIKAPQIYSAHQDDLDATFYDNVSLCEHLHVTERTLQRYRKAGKIKSTVIKGKVYYPKNFLIPPGEIAGSPVTPTKYCSPGSHQKVLPQARIRPRSRIIDLHRLKEVMCRCKWKHRQYDSAEVLRIRKFHQAGRWEQHKDVQLWPKKIKLVSLPFKKPKKMCFHP